MSTMRQPAVPDLFSACGVPLPVPDTRIVRPRGAPVPWSKVDPTEIRASLLADNAGVYGVGLTAGDRVVCRDTHSDPDPEIHSYAICLRRFDLVPARSPALQTIPPGRMWRDTAEYGLADQLLTAMLARAGFPREQGHGRGEWWSHDKGEQDSNRRHYHACKLRAYAIVNGLVRKALAAAPAEAIRVARRFPLSYRYAVYRAVAGSPRLLQLADSFPLLLSGIATADERDRTSQSRAAEAKHLVERGSKLRTIAEFARAPMALRKCRPGAVDLGLAVLVATRNDPDVDLGHLIHAYLPATTVGQRRWLSAVKRALPLGGPYVEWVARHAIELGTSRAQIEACVCDIQDWVRVSYFAEIPKHTQRAIGQLVGTEGIKLVTRTFSPDMAAHTVRDLSSAWHEAVALDDTASRVRLPAPWREGETVGDLTIVPLTTANEIVAEGRAMHHCARTYIHKVAYGDGYLFSARRGDQRVATIEVRRTGDGRVVIAQACGPCNAVIAGKVRARCGTGLGARPSGGCRVNRRCKRASRAGCPSRPPPTMTGSSSDGRRGHERPAWQTTTPDRP